MRFLIVGGSDAGISAALRARELNRDAEITVLLADEFPNFSICGLPFYLSGETPDWKTLAHRTEFAGSMGTQVVKIFDLVIGRTGLRQDEALREGYVAYTTESTSFDHKAYYPGAKQVRIRVTGECQTGRLLGAQILGSWGTEISKRIDIFATALFSGLRVDELSDLDLSYTPPLSSPWDPVQMAAHRWATAIGSEKKESSCKR
jgi:NADPH-dependent 2,4-dienoyl-CoA reductase/sulfur reductase-like enzyme